MSDIKYYRINKHRPEHGVITIASRVCGGHNPYSLKYVEFGVSYCSPKDKYDKKKGNDLATERLEMDTFAVVPVPTSSSHYGIMFNILSAIMTEETYPDWAHDILLDHLIRVAFELKRNR